MFGTVLHAGVGAFHQAVEFPGTSRIATMLGPNELAHQALQTEWDNQAIASPKLTYNLASTMLDAYIAQHRRVGPITDAMLWRILSIEARIEMKLGSAILSFQQDRAYVNDESRRIAIVDLKTVSRPDAKWTAKWYRSLQMKMYRLASMEFYAVTEVDNIIEGLTKDAKPRYVPLMLPPWSAELLAEAKKQFLTVAGKDAELIERATLNGVVDMSLLEDLALIETEYNPEFCDAYGVSCPFLDLCNAEPMFRKDILHAEYVDVPGDY